MKVAIFDHGGGKFKEEAQRAGEEVFFKGSAKIVDVPAAEVFTQLQTAEIVLCHLSPDENEALSWPKLIECSLSGVRIIIRVSRHGAGGMGDSLRAPYRLTDNGPWILHLYEYSSSVTEERWREIFTAIKAWDMKQPEPSAEIRSIFDPSSERYAFYLLCAAWIAAEGKTKKYDGGYVQAPQGMDGWLKPFGGQAVADQVIIRVGGRKECQALVKKVLDLVRDGKLAYSEHKADVATLRDALAGTR